MEPCRQDPKEYLPAHFISPEQELHLERYYLSLILKTVNPGVFNHKTLLMQGAIVSRSIASK